ncbi:hypothetical protein ACFLIM_21790 [Nonomuraea sp. M3C6]|uniref:Uncharacterized protein n=1 Tax=Nonomuraea marmarensis TaxID=3351344 RepID=A0ABW7AES6_9ACTN
MDAGARGARLAAGVSLVLAAGRLRDQAADGDAAFPAARRRLAARWEAGGTRLAAGVGFDTGPPRAADVSDVRVVAAPVEQEGRPAVRRALLPARRLRLRLQRLLRLLWLFMRLM